jgi:hypothetical protein
MPQRQEPGWQQRGFGSQDAARSVSKQYGLVQQPGGGWGKPTMDWFTNEMNLQGYGPQAQAGALNESGTPVAIGGARWMMGKNGLNFTGQQSDVPFGNQPMGQPFNSPQQTPFGQTRPRRTRTFGQVMQ